MIGHNSRVHTREYGSIPWAKTETKIKSWCEENGVNPHGSGMRDHARYCNERMRYSRIEVSSDNNITIVSTGA